MRSVEHGSDCKFRRSEATYLDIRTVDAAGCAGVEGVAAVVAVAVVAELEAAVETGNESVESTNTVQS